MAYFFWAILYIATFVVSLSEQFKAQIFVLCWKTCGRACRSWSPPYISFRLKFTSKYIRPHATQVYITSDWIRIFGAKRLWKISGTLFAARSHWAIDTIMDCFICVHIYPYRSHFCCRSCHTRYKTTTTTVWRKTLSCIAPTITSLRNPESFAINLWGPWTAFQRIALTLVTQAINNRIAHVKIYFHYIKYFQLFFTLLSKATERNWMTGETAAQPEGLITLFTHTQNYFVENAKVGVFEECPND